MGSIGGMMVKRMIEEYQKSQIMKKAITVEEVRKLALKYYEDGGDGVYECYEDSQILEEIEAGKTTENDWLKVFGVFYSVGEDIRNS